MRLGLGLGLRFGLGPGLGLGLGYYYDYDRLQLPLQLVREVKRGARHVGPQQHHLVRVRVRVIGLAPRWHVAASPG